MAGQVGPATRVVDALGRRRIAHITGPRDRTSATDRLHGYRDVLADADPPLPCEGDVAEEGGARAMGALLDRHPGTGAVFASNDTMALRTLRERGVRVPQDVAVVGLDDTASAARAAEPPLTTVRQDIEGTGRITVKLLMRLPDAPGEEVPAPVITRTTPGRRAAAWPALGAGRPGTCGRPGRARPRAPGARRAGRRTAGAGPGPRARRRHPPEAAACVTRRE
ncbi:HTH-type transcriptional repressor PurR [Streptomyces sp. enrichment culture]|uniref:substrate-binding domain-containing protein n=1 Tax=Streptomyces sp. enrichment culture TaxID=1795815 RepID=UPI003F547BFE